MREVSPNGGYHGLIKQIKFQADLTLPSRVKIPKLNLGAEILQTCVGNRGTGTLRCLICRPCVRGTASVSFPDPVLSL